ncbi:seven-hairpin glycosidase [Teratosphaeria nubilosa]|uniref:alpha-1,2-Mannosidase n=1 Tax=Teratosphaeria nubilosa TaxID=161662 RepID=A0A6G1LD02_9PEZI|nr:seven-hairpin glycosidase [Teratosphaeria nubilosa]
MVCDIVAVLPLLAAVAFAQEKYYADETVAPANYPSDWGTQSWWPQSPATTLSADAGDPSAIHPTTQPTTSLTGVGSYTYSSSANSASPYPYPNATSSVSANATLPACKKIQYDFPAGSGGNATRAAAVKEAYTYSWNAYTKYANSMDELLPLTSAGVNDWYGWGVTVVDGIDTAIIMNLTDIVEQQLAYIQKIDFTTTTYGPVEIFDTSIRYLGGLIASHDLLKSGQFPNPYDQAQVAALVSQAESLANKIAYGFNTATGISSTYVNFSSDTPVEATYTVAATNQTYNATNTASAGTFILEWFRLADVSGNQTYRYLTERGEAPLINPSPAPVYPGLVGTEFDVDTGSMLSFDGGWHGGVDSFLEYLIKTYQYTADTTTTQYKDFWLQAAQSTIQYLADHPYGFPDLTFLTELDVNGSSAYFSDSFTCFAGGNFLLGGKLLDMPALVDLGIAVTDGCHQTYNTTLTGLGPTGWGWYNSSNLAYNPADDNDVAGRKWAEKYGYFIASGDEAWEFRPEALESVFYAHRITGDPRWAEYAWEVFLAINETARNAVAFATVNNVNMPFGGSMSNSLDSFWFAEVLKYLYLIFEDPAVVSLDEWVFGTEAHPFLVQCGGGGVDDAWSRTGAVNGMEGRR